MHCMWIDAEEAKSSYPAPSKSFFTNMMSSQTVIDFLVSVTSLERQSHKSPLNRFWYQLAQGIMPLPSLPAVPRFAFAAVHQ